MSGKRGGKKGKQEAGQKEEKPISIPPDMVLELRRGQAEMSAAANLYNNFVVGLRGGLCVPKDWILHPDGSCFVPPPPKKEEPK